MSHSQRENWILIVTISKNLKQTAQTKSLNNEHINEKELHRRKFRAPQTRQSQIELRRWKSDAQIGSMGYILKLKLQVYYL